MGSVRSAKRACRARHDGRRPLLSGRPDGFSLIEVLIALAMLGVALVAGVSVARPSLEMRAATAVRSLLLQARAQAIWTGTPVAILEADGGGGFSVQAMGPAGGCEGGSSLAALRLSEFPGVRLVDGIRAGGIYWLPGGGGRSCAGGGVISDTLVLRGDRGAAAVVVSSLGRVRLERLP